jgi:rubrerythrin
MKKLFFIAITVLMIAPMAKSQSNAEEVDFFQSIFGSEKKAMVSTFINLDGEAKDAFWTNYDLYEAERKSLGKDRITLLDKYADEYEGMTDEQTDAIMKEIQNMAKANEKTILSYYKKIKKSSGSKAAAQFYHLENYFLSAIRLSILESIPVIGEFDD